MIGFYNFLHLGLIGIFRIDRTPLRIMLHRSPIAIIGESLRWIGGLLKVFRLLLPSDLLQLLHLDVHFFVELALVLLLFLIP